MPVPFNLIWSQDDTVIRGFAAGSYVDGVLVFAVTFPGKITDVQKVTLHSSAQINSAFDVLAGVKFYLLGDPDDLAIVQGLWPFLGDAFTPPRPEMNGGLQISFDGSNWTTFSKTKNSVTGVGDQADPTSWLTMPQIAVGPGGVAGQLGPFDLATMYLRYVVPAAADQYQIFNIQLAVDCDIV